MIAEQSYWQRALRRRLSRRQALRMAALGGVSALTVGSALACREEGPAQEAPPLVGPGPQDTTFEARPGGTYRAITTQDPPNLDPYLNTSFVIQTFIGGTVYSRLAKWATGPGIEPLSQAVGDAAESWETPDGMVWTFKLRPNMKFHNKPPLNGRNLDAEDVKTSMERFLARSPNRGIFQTLVDRVEAVDPLTVRFTLKFPYVPFIELMASPQLLWLFSKEANAGQIDTQKPEGVIGTGPWVLDKAQPSVSWEFTRNPEWYEIVQTRRGPQRLPFMDRLEFLVIAEYAQIMAQFLARNIHVFAPRNEDLAQIAQQVPDAQRLPGRPAWLLSFYYFGDTNDPNNLFRDPRMRRALSMALDRDGLIEAFGQASRLRQQGFEIETGWNNTPVPWGDGGMFWWLDPKGPDMGPAGQWYRYDPAEARRLLQAAGYNNQEITFNFTTTIYGTTFDQFTEAQIPMLRNAGFNIRPNPQDYSSQYITGTFAGRFSGLAYGYQTPFTSVDEYLFNMFHPQGTRYAQSRPNDQELLRLLEAQRVERDVNRRRELIREFQRRASDQMWYVPSVMGRWGGMTFWHNFVRNWGSFITAGYGVYTETVTRYWLDLPEAAAR